MFCTGKEQLTCNSEKLGCEGCFYYNDKNKDEIRVGDYVNGVKVSGKESTLLFTEVEGIDRSGYHIPISQYGEGIKSIVTKEQFESVEFKLEE